MHYKLEKQSNSKVSITCWAILGKIKGNLFIPISIIIMKNSMEVPEKLKTELPYDPAIPFLAG